MAPRLVLVGMPGVGKSTVGAALAARWRVPFADTDQLVEATTGELIGALFARSESHFRSVEASVVLTALQSFPGVLALGGGALTTATVRAALVTAPVVYLHAEVPTLITRVGACSHRPLLAGNVAARLARLAGQRRELFVGYPRIDTDRLDVETIVRRLAAGEAAHAVPAGERAAGR